MISAWFKSKTTDRFLYPLRVAVADRVPDLASILEVGAGTGHLLFLLGHRIRRGVGIELSPSLVKLARQHACRAGLANLVFEHGDATALESLLPARDRFDIATATLVVHAVEDARRTDLLRSMRARADALWLVDFEAGPSTWQDLAVLFDETLAGHLRHYRSYLRVGGMVPILQRAGLRVIQRHPLTPRLTLWQAA